MYAKRYFSSSNAKMYGILSSQSTGDISSDNNYVKSCKVFITTNSHTQSLRNPQRKGLSLAKTYVPYGEEVSYDHYHNWIKELNECVPFDICHARIGIGRQSSRSR
jgi:hypothetical protein